jgi:hypothetical protein
MSKQVSVRGDKELCSHFHLPDTRYQPWTAVEELGVVSAIQLHALQDSVWDY